MSGSKRTENEGVHLKDIQNTPLLPYVFVHVSGWEEEYGRTGIPAFRVQLCVMFGWRTATETHPKAERTCLDLLHHSFSKLHHGQSSIRSTQGEGQELSPGSSHCWMCAGTPEPEGVRGSGCLHTTLGRGLKLAPQRVKTHSLHVRVPNGAWLGKTAQTDASPAVWLPKVFNLKWIFSSERRRPQPQRV